MAFFLLHLGVAIKCWAFWGAIIKDEKIEGAPLVISFEAETEVEPGKAKLADFAYSPAEADFLHKVYEKNLLWLHLGTIFFQWKMKVKKIVKGADWGRRKERKGPRATFTPMQFKRQRVTIGSLAVEK